MGRRMESINKNEVVVLKMAPNFLINCSRHLPKQIRNEFPILMDLELSSDKWIDELQIFEPDKISDLNNEISRVYRIINLKEYIPGVNAKKMLDYWISDVYKLSDINEDIDTLKSFFEKAIELELETRIYL